MLHSVPHQTWVSLAVLSHAFSNMSSLSSLEQHLLAEQHTAFSHQYASPNMVRCSFMATDSSTIGPPSAPTVWKCALQRCMWHCFPVESYLPTKLTGLCFHRVSRSMSCQCMTCSCCRGGSTTLLGTLASTIAAESISHDSSLPYQQKRCQVIEISRHRRQLQSFKLCCYRVLL